MNEKRFMVKVQSDNGEQIQGYYAFIPKSEFCVRDRHLIYYTTQDDPDDLCCRLVDPAKVEAVPIAVERISTHEKGLLVGDCPNCKTSLTSNRNSKYCNYCGQRLDWQ